MNGKNVWIVVIFIIVISLLAISSYAFSVVDSISDTNIQECKERCNVDPTEIETAKTVLIIGIFVSTILILFMGYFIWMQFQAGRQQAVEGAKILAKLGIQKKPAALSLADIASMEEAVSAISSGSLVVGSKPTILGSVTTAPAVTGSASATKPFTF